MILHEHLIHVLMSALCLRRKKVHLKSCFLLVPLQLVRELRYGCLHLVSLPQRFTNKLLVVIVIVRLWLLRSTLAVPLLTPHDLIATPSKEVRQHVQVDSLFDKLVELL